MEAKTRAFMKVEDSGPYLPEPRYVNCLCGAAVEILRPLAQCGRCGARYEAEPQFSEFHGLEREGVDVKAQR